MRFSPKTKTIVLRLCRSMLRADDKVGFHRIKEGGGLKAANARKAYGGLGDGGKHAFQGILLTTKQKL